MKVHIKTDHEGHSDYKCDSCDKGNKDHKCDSCENHSLKVVIWRLTLQFFMMDTKIINVTIVENVLLNLIKWDSTSTWRKQKF